MGKSNKPERVKVGDVRQLVERAGAGPAGGAPWPCRRQVLAQSVFELWDEDLQRLSGGLCLGAFLGAADALAVLDAVDEDGGRVGGGRRLGLLVVVLGRLLDALLEVLMQDAHS